LEATKKDDKIKITQFCRKYLAEPATYDKLEELLADISKHDLGDDEKVQFIYSGNNEFPFDAREQWTDSCNLLALKEGVVLGYDRNDKTVEAFRNAGFTIIHAHELVQKLETGKIKPEKMEDTLI